MRAETKLWFNLAQDDWKNALLLWENHRYSATVFFCQQAVEKILKAAIVEFKKKVPIKTHRIEVLLKEAGLTIEKLNPKEVEELSKAYIRVRYPDLAKQYYIRKERVEPLVKISENIYLWVKNKLKNL